MKMITISTANPKDRKKLIEWFMHYKIKKLIRQRVEIYTSYGFTTIAKDEKKIVGVLQWYVKENPNDGVAEFEEVFVLPDHRGRGIGSMLVSKSISIVKKYFKSLNIKPRKIFLFVGENNINARKLYERNGFRFVNNLGNLFSDNEKEAYYILERV